MGQEAGCCRRGDLASCFQGLNDKTNNYIEGELMKFAKQIITLIFILGISLMFSGQANAQAAKTIKIATLAPEGTTMHKALVAMKNEVKAKTGGKVDFRIYAGGTAGDEKDVVRKMRIGQLHGAALTGVGLGMIQPEVRVLELPFLFKNYQQADTVYDAMKSYFEKKFSEKGFVLLAWTEVGFVKIFSNKPIANRADLAGVKMWMWEGDPLAEAMYETLKVVPVPLAITDVLTSLQTGLIDGAYAPELGAIAFQWHTKTKYVTDVNLVDATGGLVIANKEWAKLSKSEQNVVKQVISSQAKQLTSKTRAENRQSLEVLQSSGLQVVKLTPEALSELQGISTEVANKLVGKLYPQSLLTKVQGLVGSAP